MVNKQFSPYPAEMPFGFFQPQGERFSATMIEDPFHSGASRKEIRNAYQNEAGDIIFSTGMSDWYVLPKGEREAYKVEQTGYSRRHEEGVFADSEEMTVTFKTHVNGETTHTLKVDGDDVLLGEQELSALSGEEKNALLEASENGRISFVGLPDVRSVQAAFQAENGEYFVVSGSKTNNAYEAIRVFKGRDLQHLEEVPINAVERYRDGGTSFYKTAAGTLYVPGLFSRKESPIWTASDEGAAPVTLARIGASEVTQAIGQDARIAGIQPWDAYVASQDAANAALPANMQAALDAFKGLPSGNSVASAATLPNYLSGLRENTVARG